jgi:hypothetical protein
MLVEMFLTKMSMSKEKVVAEEYKDETSEKASKPDWTDDKFYEGAWSWVDECELEEEDKH